MSSKEISIVVCPASAEHCRQSEASILPFEDGRLLLAYTDFYAGEWEDQGPARIMGKWSPDEGETWSEPFLLQENIGQRNVMEASLLRLPSGRILLSFLRKDSQRTEKIEGLLHLMVKHSDDDGKTWSEPQQVSQGEKYWCGCHDRLLRLSSGRLLISAAIAEHCHVWISDDDGTTWRLCKKPVEVEGVSKAGEPTVVELAGGTVKMFIRNTSKFIFIAESGDGGESWEKLDKYGKWGPYSTTAPCMVRRVPGSDDLLLIWNNCLVRTNLTAAISGDGGTVWENYRILEEQEGWPVPRSHSYPSLAFLNGNAHLTYWETHNYYKPSRLFHLVYRRLPITWFYERAVRRAPVYDLSTIVREVLYPDTIFDGEKRSLPTES